MEKSTKKTIVNISSTLGSIGSDFGVQSASYSISKAALNMLVRVSLLPYTAYAYTARYTNSDLASCFRVDV